MGTTISQIEDVGALTGTERLEITKLSTAVTITASTISATAADNSFNDSGSGFVVAGFEANMHVKVTGFTGDVANNIASGRIQTVTAAKIVIASPYGDVIVDDAAGESVTISAWKTYSTDTNSVAGLGGGGSAIQSFEFVVSGDGPYTLPAVSSGDFEALYLDGMRMPAANFSVADDELTLVDLTSALYERGTIDFTPV